jgi:hypothetical protein
LKLNRNLPKLSFYIIYMAPKASSKLASAPEPVLSDDEEQSEAVAVRSQSPAIQIID